MAQKKAVIGTLAFLLVALLSVGYFALASEFGGQDDPLVTLGYLKEYEPQIKAQIDALVKEKVKAQSTELENQYAQVMAQVNTLISSSGSADFESLATNEIFVNAVAEAVVSKMGTTGTEVGSGVSSTFTRVDLEKGKTVTFSEGAMVFLRVGSATCVAPSAPGLIDLSSGSDLPNGGNMEKNHLYTVTVANGRGLKSTASQTTTIFVLGGHTVS